MINVDTAKELPTCISLCSGYGGIERGIERVIGAVNVLAHVEIEAFAIANLVDKMETERMVPTPVWTNLKTFPSKIFRDRIDILTGGYPCQPFSAAGRRLGEDDPRHLWPYIGRIIKDMRPTMCFFENVEGHVTMGLSTVISDLEGMGYTTSWGIFSAVEAGAPHQRKRVFIFAMANGESERMEGLCHQLRDTEGRETSSGQSGRSGSYWPSRPGEPQHDWEEPRVI